MERKVPIALVIGQIPDLRELLVGLLHQRPVHFAHRNNVAATVTVVVRAVLRHLIRSFEISSFSFTHNLCIVRSLLSIPMSFRDHRIPRRRRRRLKEAIPVESNGETESATAGERTCRRIPGELSNYFVHFFKR